jgi:hypothetical protein
MLCINTRPIKALKFFYYLKPKYLFTFSLLKFGIVYLYVCLFLSQGLVIYIGQPILELVILLPKTP